MTDKKGDKAGGTILEAMVSKKETETEKKGAPPAPVKAKEKDAVKAIHQEFGKATMNHRTKRTIESVAKLGGTATPVEESKGPAVVIAGMSITPIATGLKPTGSSGDLYVHEGKEFWLPHHLLYNKHTDAGVDTDEPWVRNSNYQGPEMSLYAFVYENETFYLLMDERSTFRREGSGYFGRMKGGKLIMINASSVNDQFVGDNTLANVETENCLFNQSNVIVNSAAVGRQRGWGEPGPFKAGSKRQKYIDLRLKKVDAIDSELSKGRYFSSNFNKTSIAGTGTYENDISASFLTESRIRGSRVVLEGLTAEEVDLHTEHELMIKGVSRLRNQNWDFPSIHVTNRFAFTEIDYVTRQDRGIKMVRISDTEVELSIVQWKQGVKLAIDSPRHTVEAVIREGLRDDRLKKPEPAPIVGPFGAYQPAFQPLHFRGEKPGETIRNFMESYIVEQVISRLGMIQMLDEIENTAKELNAGRATDHVNFHE